MTNANQAILEGQAAEVPVWSHENHGVQFYRFSLRVPRLSGQEDLLPVLLPEALLPRFTLTRPLRILGPLRSFNNRSGVGSRLVLSVLAREVREGTGEAKERRHPAGSGSRAATGASGTMRMPAAAAASRRARRRSAADWEAG